MNIEDFIAIIPARYASSRFPGKPLAQLGGRTVIERVYRRVSEALPNVVVALDDERIAQAVDAFGGKWVMTSPNHKSGTDRCCEAYDLAGGNQRVVINVQGDEPFVRVEQIEAIMHCFDSPGTRIATLVKPFTGTIAELENPNSPKVVVDNNGNALYFSRSVIPHLRGTSREQWPAAHQYFTHLGMYAFTAQALHEVTALPQSSLELAESLEQLRWLQNGYSIKTAITHTATIGIDTPADLERAERFLAQQQQ